MRNKTKDTENMKYKNSQRVIFSKEKISALVWCPNCKIFSVKSLKLKMRVVFMQIKCTKFRPNLLVRQILADFGESFLKIFS